MEFRPRGCGAGRACFDRQVPSSRKGPSNPPSEKRVRELEQENHRLRDALEQKERERAELEREKVRLQQEQARLEKRIGLLEARVAKEPAGHLAVSRIRQATQDHPPTTPSPCPSEKAATGTEKGKAERKPRQGHFRMPPTRLDGKKLVPLRCCPDCGGGLSARTWHRRIVQELLRPVVRTILFLTQSGYCGKCRKRVEAEIPDQVAKGSGAAGVSLGLDALSFAAFLHYSGRMPFAHIAKLYEKWGLRVTTGGLTQAMDRIGWKLTSFYEAARQAVRKAEAVFGDETSWYIMGKIAWLWTFVTAKVAFFAIRRSRGSDVVRAVVGKNFDGILHCDFWAAYADGTDSLKQRCIAHLMRELHKWMEPFRKPPPNYVRFHDLLCPIVKKALAVKKQAEAEKWPHARRQRWVTLLHGRLDRLLDKPWSNANAARLVKRLLKFNLELFLFLYHPEMEATNNRAERALRPLVIGRKVFGGSRSLRGARTLSVISTLVRTCDLRNLDFIETCKQLVLAQHHGQIHPLVQALRRG